MMQISNSAWVSANTPVAPQSRPSAQPAQQDLAQGANISAPGPAPASPQFDSQLLVALLNTQEVRENQSGTAKDQANTAKALSLLGPQAQSVGNIASSDGPLAPSEIQGQSATSLSNDLVTAFGSNGSLSESDMNQALDAGATAPASVLQRFDASVDGNWNELSGGSESMTAAQLSAAIAKYLPTGSDGP
jgi:hypothetical protein